MSVGARTVLPCGTDLEHLLERVAEGEQTDADRHLATCPYCQEAMEVLEPAWTAVRRWAASDIRAPGWLAGAVLRRIESRRPRRRVPLVATLSGATVASEWVVRLVVVGAANELAEVRAAGALVGRGWMASGRDAADLVALAADGVDVSSASGELTVSVPIGIELGTDVGALAERVRDVVRGRLEAMLALADVRVDVQIADVVAPRDAPPDAGLRRDFPPIVVSD